MHVSIFYRKQLEEALQLYETHMDKQERPPVVAEARSSLAYLCFKMGEWDKGQDYLESALKVLKGLDFDPSVSLLCDS